MCDQHEGSPCLGLVIGVAIAIPVNAALAWMTQIVINRGTGWHASYWQALVLLLCVGAVVGGLIIVRELLRNEQRKETPDETSSL